MKDFPQGTPPPLLLTGVVLFCIFLSYVFFEFRNFFIFHSILSAMAEADDGGKELAAFVTAVFILGPLGSIISAAYRLEKGV